MGLLLSLLVAEKSGFQLAEHPAGSELGAFTEQVTRQAMESIQQAVGARRPRDRPNITATGRRPSRRPSPRRRDSTASISARTVPDP